MLVVPEFDHCTEAAGSSNDYPEILFLGTGSAIPNKVRNVSAIWLNLRYLMLKLCFRHIPVALCLLSVEVTFLKIIFHLHLIVANVF